MMEVVENTSHDHPSEADLAEATAWVLHSPQDTGRLEMIVARPEHDRRQLLVGGELTREDGLRGDNWAARDGTQPDRQITLMNVRALQAVAGERGRWPLAGDQLIVDLDLSAENLPPGQQLLIGQAVLEITTQPHTGCAKFTERFGHAAIRWVNSPEGRQLRLRGAYARVIQPGSIQVGDTIFVKRAQS
jgi:MOSC domain-containing protein YiiM